MLHVISQSSSGEDVGLLDQMFSLRARQFGDRRGWRVVVGNGRETDDFDTMNPTYIIVSDGRDRVLASVRLLPTVGPHMLADVFPATMGKRSIIRHPLVWESSRFCVHTTITQKQYVGGVNMVTRELLRGLFETAHSHGIKNVVSVYDIFVERVLKKAGCRFERLGPVIRYDNGLKTVAGIFEVSSAVIARLEQGYTSSES